VRATARKAPSDSDEWIDLDPQVIDLASETAARTSITRLASNRRVTDQNRQERTLTIVSTIGVGFLLLMTFGVLAYTWDGKAREEVPLAIRSPENPRRPSQSRIGDRRIERTASVDRESPPKLDETETAVAKAARPVWVKASTSAIETLLDEAPELPLGPQKLAIPSADVQGEIAGQLDDIYELPKAKEPPQKLRLAKELFKLTKQWQGDQAEKFVLLRTAAELAGDGGNADLMIEIVDAVDTEFEIDAMTVKARMLKNFAREATGSGEIESLVTVVQSYIDEALARRRYDLAWTVIATTYEACQRSPGRAFRKDMFDRRREVRELLDRRQKLQEAADVLESDPANPEANLALGRLYCFDRDDWRRGLPHLVKGRDPVLAYLARQDLDSPYDAADQVRLADAWWQAAENYQGADRVAMLVRAGDWYRIARQMIRPGLVQVKLDRRLAEIARINADSAPQAGASQPAPPLNDLLVHPGGLQKSDDRTHD